MIALFLKKQAIALIGWGLVAVLFGLWQGAKTDLTREIERCNTDKMTSVAEAERVAREAVQKALDSRIAQLEKQADNAERARQIAEEARIEAESRPEKVRTVIRRVREQDSCIDTDIHPDLLRCLRDDKDCRDSSTDTVSSIRTGAGAG